MAGYSEVAPFLGGGKHSHGREVIIKMNVFFGALILRL